MAEFWQALVGNLAVVGLVISAWTYVRRLAAGQPEWKRQIIFGMFMACGVVATMSMSVTIAPGTYFDLRSVLISTAGLFGGPYAAIISMLAAALFRTLLGGAGLGPGLIGIVLSAAAGLLAHLIARHREPSRWDVVWIAAAGVVIRIIGFALAPAQLKTAAISGLLLPMSALGIVATLMAGFVLIEIRRRALDFDLLTAALYQAPDYSYVKNRRSEFVAVNAAVAALHGQKSPSALFGKTDFDIDEPHRASALFATEQQLMASATDMKELEEELTTKTGERRWYSTSKVPLRNGDGVVFGLAGVTRDVTERKRFDQDLIEAKARAEVASEAKTEFLATMSHEIRSPLNAIVGFTYLALDEPGLAPSTERKLRLIHGAGEMLQAVVNDILDFSKIEAGEIELESQSFDLREVIESVLAVQAPVADGKGLELRVVVEPVVPTRLIGDPSRLGQVLLNLVGNAVKFTENGRVSIIVSTLEGSSAETAFVRLAVSDTGIGITEDKLGRLFGRFSQVDGTISRRFGGSGLGLAISKRLVELMGGSIGVQSVEGVGSTFWFDVALAATEQLPAHAEPEAAQATALRILLADDLATNAEIACALLRRAGHHVDAVSGGADAVEGVRTGSYDLVLMDIQMPQMDGLTATRLIRGLNGQASGIPVIAMSANVLPGQIETFKHAGMNDHIAKPFRRQQLLEVLARWAPKNAKNPVAQVAAFNVAVLTELKELLGPDCVHGHLVELVGALNVLLGDTGNLDVMSTRAHRLVSAAGMLGFETLSQVAAQLETALATQAEHAFLLEVLENQKGAVLKAIEAHRAA